ncbi:hypothetical protein NF27_AP00040 [Candidatus Jidaibacter acanthamoeba]|uniref:Uncharacterized protein n=1 Tax=Candidatus Jidaibacter acanthamoebae TaxID=86105 RepID=A0A0C1N1I7_9RICK|nr:hypothetical protein NF27_BE00030 [Candidatus Jidaibacter acanthamoeba]KIE06256.1 hypothetical protein NF27_AP00040 [Candidatus Jidaibacter acanthamoeba]
MKEQTNIVINDEMSKIAEKVSSLPSLQNEALGEIIKGLYMGKPLLGEGEGY